MDQVLVLGIEYYNYISKKDNLKREGYNLLCYNPDGENKFNIFNSYHLSDEMVKKFGFDKKENRDKFRLKKVDLVGDVITGRFPRFDVTDIQ